ncbi:hypothetical protein ACQQ2N_14000 [Dokdonella sp. MW10]|uniref:hypothetical protein n=1 Tax=Dokdonella sp. MW10 TaxID=2992926 RepID=UPI003F81FC9F
MTRGNLHLPSRSRALASRLAVLLLALLAWPSASNAQYGFDLRFSAQGYVYDAFGVGSAPSLGAGNRHVVLPNGDIVVAGRVRLPNDTVQPYWNIGLARYKRLGGFAFWNGPTTNPYRLDESHIVYPNLPNGGTGDTKIESVDDIAYADDTIFVLVTRVLSASPPDRDAAIVVFNGDGSFRQNLSVIAASVDEFGRRLDVRTTNLVAKPVTVTILAQRQAPGPRMVIAKYNVGNNGLLAADPGFNSGAPFEVPIGTACAGTNLCNLEAADMARPFRIGGGDAMPIYAVGAVQRNGADWDYAITKVTASGTLDTSFGLGGVRYVPFDEAASDRGDFGRALHVDGGVGPNPQDTLFVAGNVHRSCTNGIGIVGLTGNGLDLGGFGSNGRVVIGGSNETGSLCAQEPAHTVWSLTRQDGELAVAGLVDTPNQGGGIDTDGLLVRIDRASGALRSLDAIPAGDANGRFGRVRLIGISPVGERQYIVSGELTDVPLVGSGYVSARLQPADRLFWDGFDVSHLEQ